MIAIKRLTIGTQYWFIFKRFKVFGRYDGRDKNVLKLSDAFIYFTQSHNDSFCIEQYLLLDGRLLVNVKINDSDPDNDFSEYYLNETL